MTYVAATLSVCALIVAIVALLAALDAREFWRALLEDYRGAQLSRERRDRMALVSGQERTHVER